MKKKKISQWIVPAVAAILWLSCSPAMMDEIEAINESLLETQDNLIESIGVQPSSNGTPTPTPIPDTESDSQPLPPEPVYNLSNEVALENIKFMLPGMELKLANPAPRWPLNNNLCMSEISESTIKDTLLPIASKYDKLTSLLIIEVFPNCPFVIVQERDLYSGRVNPKLYIHASSFNTEYLELTYQSWIMSAESRGDNFSRSKRYELAISEYRLAIEHGQDTLGIKRKLADMLFNAKRYDDAEKIYLELIASDYEPKEEIFFNLYALKFNQRLYGEAEKYLLKYREINPDKRSFQRLLEIRELQAPPSENRGKTFYVLKKTYLKEEARSSSKTLAVLEEDFEVTFLEEGKTYYRIYVLLDEDDFTYYFEGYVLKSALSAVSPDDRAMNDFDNYVVSYFGSEEPPEPPHATQVLKNMGRYRNRKVYLEGENIINFSISGNTIEFTILDEDFGSWWVVIYSPSMARNYRRWMKEDDLEYEDVEDSESFYIVGRITGRKRILNKLGFYVHFPVVTVDAVYDNTDFYLRGK